MTGYFATMTAIYSLALLFFGSCFGRSLTATGSQHLHSYSRVQDISLSNSTRRFIHLQAYVSELKLESVAEEDRSNPMCCERYIFSYVLSLL